MPRYYFDMNDGDQQTIDDIGLDFPDIEAARQEASRALAEITRMHVPAKDDWACEVLIRTETGQPPYAPSLR